MNDKKDFLQLHIINSITTLDYAVEVLTELKNLKVIIDKPKTYYPNVRMSFERCEIFLPKGHYMKFTAEETFSTGTDVFGDAYIEISRDKYAFRFYSKRGEEK